MKIHTGLALLALTCISSVSFGFASALPVWVNGVPVWQQGDVATLVTPATITMTAGSTTPLIFGSIYKNNLTEAAGPASNVVAQLGYGAIGSDPRYSTWTWLPVTYDQQLGIADEYTGNITISTPGTYAYTYRFSLDNGGTWTAADLAGDGENPAVAFDSTDIGTLNVTETPVPEPASMGVLGSIAVLFFKRRRHN
ncbi:MAG TPA: PEP-CTERM sorting domain-containing protein [Tepidisphaeraceae bacterium]|jgi:hypothetical protein